MPTGNLPAEGKKLFEEVYDKALKGSCKGEKDPEACAAGSAWKAVKSAGWRKDAKGQWHKGDLVEFSLAITKASYDKATGERRWLAKCSDTNLDSYEDKMSTELFMDFVDRIKRNEPAPEDFRSEFWSGGMPYLSVSHYPDLDGSAVPGPVDDVFVDGDVFKSKGKCSDTPLGNVVWEALKKDSIEKPENPIRISIAFLDYKHRHLSGGYVFERSMTDPKRMICPKCIEEAVTGEYGGKEFLRGQLVHLAMTRVPVNKRTLMEVDRSMTTRKEDAASIVGEELADELDEKAKLVGKSDALVIKAEETDSNDVPDADDIEADDANPSEESEIISEQEKIMSALAELKSEISELVSVLRAKNMKEDEKEDEEEPEEGDEEYKDKKKKKKEEMKSEVVEEVEPEINNIMRAGFSDLAQRLDILISAMSQNVTPSGVPQRRSMVPTPNYAPPVAPQRDPNKPMTISEMVHKSVMGQ
jgi:hypothetical protein